MSKTLLAVAATALFVFTACKPAAPAGVMVGGAMMVQTKTIVENAAAADNLKTLVAAVRAAKLEATLAGPGPFTVFAPTDQAFAALPAGALQALLKPENADLLTQLLTYHVVPGKMVSSDFTNGMRLRTAEGKELLVEIDTKGMVTVNGVAVSIANVPASNGVVHVIDAVLLPPVGGETTSASSSSDGVQPATTTSSSAASQPAVTGAPGVMVGVMMEGSAMIRVLDNGVHEQMRTDIRLTNGAIVRTDGTVTKIDGSKSKLKAGEMLLMNGEMTTDLSMPPKAGTTSSSAVVPAQPGAAVSAPEYGVYTEGVVGNGQTSVLFFHAPWCPVCREADKELAQWYVSEKLARSTYRVDYDTSGPLKQKYGVTYQHTFVLIDGTGKELKKLQGPTEDELLALLKA